jgi:hypothetical protein
MFCSSFDGKFMALQLGADRHETIRFICTEIVEEDKAISSSLAVTIDSKLLRLYSSMTLIDKLFTNVLLQACTVDIRVSNVCTFDDLQNHGLVKHRLIIKGDL